MRASVAGRNPTSGSSRRLASSSFDPYDCVNEPSSESTPRSPTSRWLSSRASPHWDRPHPPVLLDRPSRAIECHPGHGLGVDEVATSAADLPDPVVRLSPRLREMGEHAELQLPRVRIEGKPVQARLVE